ncbi:MAG: hypothetical protein LKM31_10860 [Sphingobium sp.]|jgi:hypothetical protein|uniref:hypothetical protein n=1 Tax=Sphingobium sp. JS3065 TaxID=2970925 RepID=UPI000BDAC81D|nr:hypothetical protein [Sphingobium sp. JS3065]MCI1271655.1 hypothetical protein [Sphingobium sp.]OYW24250.1 MAG: hypothetical protein B7Z43_00030 [Sphingomonas sp. 12-62-6]MCI1756224.1 hypothetical protein [Sphingobium sp.]MCI2053876.1 hypothetical protein [Sphingobium sp.]UZW56633.1 hypothetical protein NUH86_07740 [Sphingobium sp. JS3065]
MATEPPAQSRIWSYKIDECDVEDRDALVRFRARSESWSELLRGDPAHSISSQFNDMLWQDAAWRMANEARRYAQEDGPNASVAPILGAMLDRGYVAGQVIAIGRLLEKSNPRQPQRGVVSLRRIVDEIRADRDLFTREIFVCQDGLPYDWESARERDVATWMTKHDPNEGAQMQWLPTQGPDAWMTAKQQHELFDILSGTGSQVRTRTDDLGDAVLDGLDSVLGDQVFTDLLALRNKTIAHAADTFSRAQAAGLRQGLNLEEFARAHYLLLGVLQAVSACLLYGEWRGSAVPVPQHDQFAHLESAFVPEGRMKELRAYWRQHCDERDGWLSTAYHEVIPKAE